MMLVNLHLLSSHSQCMKSSYAVHHTVHNSNVLTALDRRNETMLSWSSPGKWSNAKGIRVDSLQVIVYNGLFLQCKSKAYCFRFKCLTWLLCVINTLACKISNISLVIRLGWASARLHSTRIEFCKLTKG